MWEIDSGCDNANSPRVRYGFYLAFINAPLLQTVFCTTFPRKVNWCVHLKRSEASFNAWTISASALSFIRFVLWHPSIKPRGCGTLFDFFRTNLWLLDRLFTLTGCASPPLYCFIDKGTTALMSLRQASVLRRIVIHFFQPIVAYPRCVTSYWGSSIFLSFLLCSGDLVWFQHLINGNPAYGINGIPCCGMHRNHWYTYAAEASIR